MYQTTENGMTILKASPMQIQTLLKKYINKTPHSTLKDVLREPFDAAIIHLSGRTVSTTECHQERRQNCDFSPTSSTGNP